MHTGQSSGGWPGFHRSGSSASISAFGRVAFSFLCSPLVSPDTLSEASWSAAASNANDASLVMLVPMAGEAAAFDDHSDDLTPNLVTDLFCDDLAARGVAVKRPEEPFSDPAWKSLLEQTYPAPDLAAA